MGGTKEEEPGGGLIGREREIARLTSFVTDASAGTGRVVVLAGEAGIGKTTLAEETARRARSAGFRTLWGSCWEGDGTPAYWPWLQIVRACARDETPADLLADMGEGAPTLARFVPEIAGRFLSLPPPEEEGDPERARFRLFDAVATLLRNASAREPLLVVVDDLHWADRASLSMLRFLARSSRDASILLLGTYRDTEQSRDHPLYEVLGDLGADRVALGGLDRDGVGRLIASTTGTPAQEAVVGAVAGRTTGNPFFVKEVARLLDAQGRLGDEGAAVRLAIPEGVRDVLGRRLARLPGECVDVLGAAAVLGTEFRADILAATAALNTDRLLTVIDQAVAARVMTEDPEVAGRYTFAHALFREVLYDGLGTSRRATLHAAAGEALEKAYASSLEPHLAELASHFLRAVPAGDAAKAADYCSRAGVRALSMYAYETAAAHFRRGLDVVPASNTAARIHGMLNLADALTRSGDLPAAREAYESVAVVAREAGDAEALAHAALGLGTGLGGFEIPLFDHTQIGLLREALDALPADVSPLRAWLMARLSVAQSFVVSIAERTALSRAAVAMARSAEEPTALAYALSSLCDALAGPDHVQERLDAATEMLRLSAEIRSVGGMRSCGVPSCDVCLCDPEMSLLAHRFLVVANLELGEIDTACEHVDAYARVAGHLRQPLTMWYVPLWRAMHALIHGRWDEADERIGEVRDYAERTHSENATVLAFTARAELMRLQDHHDRVRETIGPIYEMLPALMATTPQGRITMAYAEAVAGDHDAARRTLGETPAPADFPRDSEYLSTSAGLTYIAWELEDRDIARRAFDMLAGYEHLIVVDGIGAALLGAVPYFLALNATVLGSYDTADAHFDAALSIHERMGSPALVAITRRDFARALLRQGDARAAAAAEDAARAFEELGLPEAAASMRALTAARAAAVSGTFRREGDVWLLGFAGEEARVKHAKGLSDIATLLARPSAEVGAIELVAARAPVPAAGRLAAEEAGGVEGDAGPVLDERARAEYKRRLAELEDERREAEENNDVERAARAQEQIAFIASELAAAYGLGGRARKTADPAERARKAVTERIRDSIGRIAAALPSLGDHLRQSVRTGTFCSYEPAEPVTWTL